MMNSNSMSSNKPYLLRAFHEWIVDNRCTPILVLNVHHPRCRIPQEYVDGDEIVFNVSPSAVRELKMTNQAIEFKASFSGIVHVIYAPVSAVMAIYAEENGEGLFFDKDDMMDDADLPPVKLTTIDGFLKEVQGEEGEASGMPPAQAASSRGKPSLKLVE